MAYIGISKRIGNGYRIGTAIRVGSSRRVPVYTQASCDAFRDEMYADRRARGLAAPNIDRTKDSLGRRFARQLFGSGFVPYVR